MWRLRRVHGAARGRGDAGASGLGSGGGAGPGRELAHRAGRARPLGRIADGQTVLIHAAAGGTGQVAVKMAKHYGATVVATASLGKHETCGRWAPTTSSIPAAPISPPRCCG